MKPQRAVHLQHLVDANPQWVDGWPDRKGVGIQFDCPIHERCDVRIPLANPVDGRPAFRTDHHLWNRTGDSFDTLTIDPSIHVLGETISPDGCEWHGWVRNGRFETCEDSK